jgi:hypothetical protein
MQALVQTFFGSVFTIVLSIALAVLLLFVLQRCWPPPTRKLHNDMVGSSVGVIGTTYAVIIAFMLSGVWGDFETAQVNAEQEANCLVNVYRFADRLPKDVGGKVQQSARDYASTMVNQEWPAMTRETSSEAGHQLMKAMWKLLIDLQNQDTSQQLILDHTLSQLTNLTEHRRIRLLQSHKQLPAILWAVLIVGAIVTVASTCLFGVENFRLHVLQVSALTLLVSLMLVAIADIDRPFQGNIRVPPDGFLYALHTFDQWQQPAQ